MEPTIEEIQKAIKVIEHYGAECLPSTIIVGNLKAKLEAKIGGEWEGPNNAAEATHKAVAASNAKREPSPRLKAAAKGGDHADN